jgi:hypothetical protein
MSDIVNKVLLNFENYHDVFNTGTENYNVNKVKSFNHPEVLKLYNVESNLCPICNVIDNPLCSRIKIKNGNLKPYTGDECPWRIKLIGKKYKCVQTHTFRDNPYSVITRKALFYWSVNHNVDKIIRPTSTNGLSLDHLTGNPFNDLEVALTEKHAKKHGNETRIKNSMILCDDLYSKYKDPDIKKLKLKFNGIKENAQNTREDSPLVWKIIYENTRLIDGKISENEFQEIMNEICSGKKG